jgi:alpha-methylacyl-CoA racemase
MSSPLHGLKVIEFEGIGPGPVAGMFLAQHGASVTLVRRPTPLAVKGSLAVDDPIDGAKRGLAIDLKRAAGVELALRLVEQADVLIEGNRPGVMERLGLGPDVCAARNPRLVYGRMTGWGQSGPLAHAAGHDLNYVALTGLLSLSRRAGTQPIVPPTIVGDAAGALGLAFGLIAGVFEARRTGRGSVVDAAMVDITAMLGALVHLLKVRGQVATDRPSMFYDSPFYDVYGCADGKSITVGALEPQFYALLLAKLGMSDVDPAAQYDTSTWPALKERFARLFATRSRDEWCTLLEGSNACFAPVLDLDEAAAHPHLVARGVYQQRGAGTFAAPAPRFSGNGADSGAEAASSTTSDDLLAELGLSSAAIAELLQSGVVSR